MAAHRTALVIPAQGIDTSASNPASQLQLNILMAVAEFERSMILERQREGIAIARAAGKYKGRKASLSQAQVSELQGRLANGESVTALAAEYGGTHELSIGTRPDVHGQGWAAHTHWLLGHTDASSFFRAFRQWEGTSPGRWRKAGGQPYTLRR